MHTHKPKTTPGQLGATIARVLARRGHMPQYQYAAAAHIHHASLGRIIAGARPDRDTLEALCDALAHREDAVEIALAHAEDELQAAGVIRREYVLRAATLAATSPDAVDRAADALVRSARERSAGGRHDLARIIIELATIGAALVHTQAPDMLKVAEPPAPDYGDPHNSRLRNSKK